MTPLSQLASFQVPEARMAIISPFDKGAMASIEKAIRDSDLGVNPGNDGVVSAWPSRNYRGVARSTSRLYVPKRKIQDFTSQYPPPCQRNDRELEKDSLIGKDDLTRGEKDLEKLTSDHVSKIDDLLKHKEIELLEV